MRPLFSSRLPVGAVACLAAIMLACAGANGSAPAAGDGGTTAAAGSASAASTRQTAEQAVPAFDGARAWGHLEAQVGFGPRPSGSDAIGRTRAYITDTLRAAGVMVREQPFVGKTPLGDVPMVNLVATLPGRRSERIALASHYDTKLFDDFTFVGANDGGSSTAVLIELGRALAGGEHEFTIELLFLDGEEARRRDWEGLDNTYGSRHYVDAARQDGTLRGLRALVLLDMVGDRDLILRRDSNSTPWLVDTVWATAEGLGHRATFSNQLTAVEDDHVPFLRAGVPAVDLIDLDTPARRGTWHTPLDTLDYVSQRSLQIVGDVVLAALPAIEARLAAAR